MQPEEYALTTDTTPPRLGLGHSPRQVLAPPLEATLFLEGPAKHQFQQKAMLINFAFLFFSAGGCRQRAKYAPF